MKVVLDRQPLLGTGRLPDRLRNFLHGWLSKTVSLDTFNDNLCLWRCIAVHQGARPDRSIHLSRELAKSYFKLRAAPNDILEDAVSLPGVSLHYLLRGTIERGTEIYGPGLCYVERSRGGAG